MGHSMGPIGFVAREMRKLPIVLLKQDVLPLGVHDMPAFASVTGTGETEESPFLTRFISYEKNYRIGQFNHNNSI